MLFQIEELTESPMATWLTNSYRYYCFVCYYLDEIQIHRGSCSNSGHHLMNDRPNGRPHAAAITFMVNNKWVDEEKWRKPLKAGWNWDNKLKLSAGKIFHDGTVYFYIQDLSWNITGNGNLFLSKAN